MTIVELSDPAPAWPVLQQLRPHLDKDQYLDMAQTMMQEGFRLAVVEHEDEVVAVAGFRISHMLFRSKFLYIDDLVADSSRRGAGHGGQLFDWLCELARQEGCQQVVLDSGVQRHDAHRFYLRKRMEILAYNFTLKLGAA